MNLSNLINYRALLLLALAFVLSSVSSCKKDNDDDVNIPDTTSIGKAQAWLTRGDKVKLFNKEADILIKPVSPSNWSVIEVDTAVTYQTVEGYGAALTGSSAWLFNQEMDAVTRQKTLEALFDPEEGIGISYLRLTMGASDFSLSDFTYNDMPAGQTDFSLQQFSLGQDRQDVIPVLKDIIAISPDIKLMGTPWSPPAWMKTNGNLKGGKLKANCYEVYANYFVKYVEQMQQEGITIDAVTPQNEPLYFTANYPCMEMQSGEQLLFIKSYLGPKFMAAGLNTKIIVYDHNWDNTDYAISILNDQEARNYVSGSAFHAYGGQVSAMSVVHNAHPDKGLYFTEISGGAWATNFSDNLMWNMKNIFIGTALNWSKTALLWNLALDQGYGPQNGGCGNCRGVITVNTVSGQVTYNEEYYAIAHFSKFVRPGAVRIAAEVPQTLSNVEAVAFQNTDGTKAMVVCNYGSTYTTFSVNQGNKRFDYSVPPQGVVTLVW